MMLSLARKGTLVTLVLTVALLGGCASGPSGPQSSAAAVESALPTPVQSKLAPTTEPASPTPTRAPTSTPTPKPPTPTPSPARSEAAAQLLKQVRSKQQAVKSARGLMEIDMQVRQAGQPIAVKMLAEFEIAEPDSHMTMTTKGMPFSLNMEVITKGDTTYMKMDDQWVSMPGGGKRQARSQMGVMDVDDMEAFLADASSVKIVGRRDVKGVECDVVSFRLSPEKMMELAALRGQASGEQTRSQDLKLDQFDAEVAVGVADKLLRQMVFRMSGYDSRKAAEKFDMTITMTMWDFNSPSILIKAPEGAKPMVSPTATRRTPAPARPTPTALRRI